MSSFPPPPPPPPAITTTAPRTTTPTTSSIIIVIIIIASAIIVSVGIYLLLQLLSRKFHRSFRTHSDVVVLSSTDHHRRTDHLSSTNNNDDQLLLLTSLPLFTFSSLGNLTTADCAVCLSKFHPHDQLRLLPLCCHAFHSDCIDSWILSNHTCPLCRSIAFPSEADVLDKIRTSNGSNSFRIEIGSVSDRRINTEHEEEEEASNSRSYSIGGSFEYVVDENEYEVSVGSVSRRTGDKEPSARGVQPPGEELAAEVAGGGSGRNWLRDYIDRASSSFRGSSGRFFTGSSRRNNIDTDLEANQRAGEEITEYFRWFSGY